LMSSKGYGSIVHVAASFPIPFNKHVYPRFPLCTVFSM
jgi:hypothetical protein